jgi:hypothetical protein
MSLSAEYNRILSKRLLLSKRSSLKISNSSINFGCNNDTYRTVNRSTFKCPFCDLKNFERKGLIEHITKHHKGMPGVCPICSSQPYGDPNYVSQNLSGHMKMRH